MQAFVDQRVVQTLSLAPAGPKLLTSFNLLLPHPSLRQLLPKSRRTRQRSVQTVSLSLAHPKIMKKFCLLVRCSNCQFSSESTTSFVSEYAVPLSA